MEWQVVESRLLSRQLERAPKKVRGDYKFWRESVRDQGPNLRGGYRTHALRGGRKGQKAAWLGRQWRVIFKIVENQLIVEALELTPHKY